MADTSVKTPKTNKESAEDQKDFYAKWLEAVERSERERNTWWTQGDKIIKVYRDSLMTGTSAKSGRYNLFWSNVETLLPALYSQTPQSVVSTRWRDGDPAARLASMILERTLTVQLDAYDFDHSMDQTVLDLCLSGLGQGWVEYKPVMQGEGEDATVAYEYSRCRYLHWKDYLEGPARVWEEVPWVAKKERMTRDEIAALPGVGPEVADEVKYDAQGVSNDKNAVSAAAKNMKDKTALVYDIWDKKTRKQILICTGYKDKALRVNDDPLKLSEFFPCPRPLMATTTNDTRIPVPDYVEVQHQYGEINELSERIRLLTKALKVAGIYNGGTKGLDLNQLFKTADNKMIKVDSWAAFAEKGGIRGNMEFLPIDEIAKVIQSLVEMRAVLKTDVAELTGLADLQRGNTNPNETLGAQQLKAQFGNRRMSKRQKEIARFARDILRLKGEIVAEHFSPETLWEASGCAYVPEAVTIVPPPPPSLIAQAMQRMGMKAPTAPPKPQRVPSDLFNEAVELLKSDKQRLFRIDVETDSTIMADENAEKQRRTEFLTAMGTFLPSALEMAQMTPSLAPLLGKMILFAVRGFRVGRPLEADFEQAIDSMEQQQKQPQAGAPGAQPSPEDQAAAKEAQTNQMKAEGDLKTKQQQMEGELQIKRQQMLGELQIERDKQAGLLAIKANTTIPA